MATKKEEYKMLEKGLKKSKGKITKGTEAKAKAILARQKAENEAIAKERSASAVVSSKAKSTAAENKELLSKYRKSSVNKITRR